MSRWIDLDSFEVFKEPSNPKEGESAICSTLHDQL